MNRNRIKVAWVIILLMFFFALAAKGGATDRVVKVVYLIPSDREPHPDYAERLDYLFKKIQSFYRDQMYSAGYLDGSGHGKTFPLETDTSGNLIVHLIDHRPGGTHADPSKDLAFYHASPYHIDTEIISYFGSAFLQHAVVVRITDMSYVNDDHTVAYAPNAGTSASAADMGPGHWGSVWLADHIFGNDLTYSGMSEPPIVFETIGRNDAEQLAIFHDTRYTNILGDAPYYRPAPPYWNPGEYHHFRNLMVWESASTSIGAVTHELGHAFGLKHCPLWTESNVPAVFTESQMMGQGFRQLFAALFPDEPFLATEQYPRHPASQYPQIFGTPTIISFTQLPCLNRNWYFNAGITFQDYGDPIATALQIIGNGGTSTFPQGTSSISVETTSRDATSANASGLSHITYMMDANTRGVSFINPADAFLTTSTAITLELSPGESSDIVFSKGLHSINAEVMDQEGNISDPEQTTVFFNIDEYRIEDWLIWDQYFNAVGATYHDMLTHYYLSVPDSALAPYLNQGSGGHYWRHHHSGPYVAVSWKANTLFTTLATSIHRVSYAATRLLSNRPRNLKLWIGNDDYSQVFLNGGQVFLEDTTQPPHDPFSNAFYHSVPVTINRGENLLLAKVLDVMFGSGFHVWFEELNGEPVVIVPYPSENPDLLSVIIREHPWKAKSSWHLYK